MNMKFAMIGTVLMIAGVAIALPTTELTPAISRQDGTMPTPLNRFLMSQENKGMRKVNRTGLW